MGVTIATKKRAIGWGITKFAMKYMLGAKDPERFFGNLGIILGAFHQDLEVAAEEFVRTLDN